MLTLVCFSKRYTVVIPYSKVVIYPHSTTVAVCLELLPHSKKGSSRAGAACVEHVHPGLCRASGAALWTSIAPVDAPVLGLLYLYQDLD